VLKKTCFIKKTAQDYLTKILKMRLLWMISSKIYHRKLFERSERSE